MRGSCRSRLASAVGWRGGVRLDCWRVCACGFLASLRAAFLFVFRKLQPQAPLKTPPARASLKYPGRDRTKNRPTQKRKNLCRAAREVILPICPARAQATCLETTVLADQGSCNNLGTGKAALKQGSVTCECRLRKAILIPVICCLRLRRVPWVL